MNWMNNVKAAFFLFFFLGGCNSFEHTEKEKIKRQNASAEYVQRKSDEKLFSFPPPKKRIREPYPWEDPDGTLFPKITKEFFRCKGSPSHLPRGEKKDCDGFEKHSLPVLGDREYIYPVLIDLLNFIQKKTKKKIVVTCGHRCPVHNAYADDSKENQTSKHLIGAEVDFYVQGMEDRSLEIIDLLFQFYKETQAYKGVVDYERFYRYRGETDVSTLPWYNKEVFIKLYQKGEGRDFDNRHPFPYISIQVRYDREKKKPVSYTWGQAHQGFHRY
jgi:hypothetical protein